MTLSTFFKTAMLLFVLLNPFLMVVYLKDVMNALEPRAFARVIFRGASIALVVFVLFAATGDAVFSDVLQVQFASFLVFGGLIFLIIGIRFVLQGTDSIMELRGPPEHVAGSIAMPFMVGPGTVSASILAGARMPLPLAAASIATGLFSTILCVLALKVVHDKLATSRQALADRYIDIIGRISALVIGTISVDMIMRGLEMWWRSVT